MSALFHGPYHTYDDIPRHEEPHRDLVPPGTAMHCAMDTCCASFGHQVDQMEELKQQLPHCVGQGGAAQLSM